MFASSNYPPDQAAADQFVQEMRHGTLIACTADGYVLRIEERLRHLAETRWYVQQPEIRRWLRALDAALRSTGSATLAFAVLPRLHE